MKFCGMRSVLSQVWFRLLGYGSNGRSLDVYPDDRFLVGYPKSGNTWLDFMVACLLAQDVEDVNFFTIENYVADIYFNNARRLRALSRPRFLKSHEPYDDRYKKVVYIVRDPRDVAVSYYYHHLKLGMWSEQEGLGLFVRKFVDGRLDGFGSWGGHVRGWLENRDGDPGFLLVRYEGLKRDAVCTLRIIAQHLGVDITPNRLVHAVSWSSVENMRKLESDAVERRYPSLSRARRDIYFVRKGISGGWRKHLSPEDRQLIEDAWGDEMRCLGYLG